MLIVEDGTSKADAESYASVADADAFLSSRGMTIWSDLSEPEKEQALRRASDYMVAEYRPKWLGKRTSAVQSLDWPRTDVTLDDVGVIPTNFVPREIVRACIELAFRAASGELLEDEEARILEETVGPITTKYDSVTSHRKKYVVVDNLLNIFTNDIADDRSVGLVKLVRC